MAIQVRDIMTRPVVYAQAETTLRELMDLLRANRISGVPVVDEELRLVGVISETDLICHDLAEGAEPQDTLSLKEGVLSVERQYRIEELDRPVSDLMIRQVLTCELDDDISSACKLFATYRVHRLVVMSQGEIAGILTPVDVVRAIAQGAITP